MNTEQTITADRLARGLDAPGPRRILITLAIRAGYDFVQISQQLRSGIGDERADLPGGGERVALNRGDRELAGPGSETLDEYRRRCM